MAESIKGEDIAAKITRGIVWGWSSNGINAILNIAILAILARLLSPNDFGLMASVNVVVNFLSLFLDMGMAAKVVQKQDSTHKELSSVFYCNLSVGILLLLIMVAFSSSIANFYSQQALKKLVELMSVSFLIIAAGSLPHALLQKSMKFDIIARIDISGTLVYSITAASFAYFGFGVFSLAIGVIARSIWGTANYLLFANWRPGRWYGISIIKDYLTFGASVSGSKFFNFLAANIDYILIGKFLGPQALGIYTLAYQLVTFPLTKISRTISNVTLPAFSKLQTDSAKITELFLRITRRTSMIAFPLLAGLFVIAPEFIDTVYGPKWVDAIDLVQFLCIAGVLKSVGTLVSNIYIVKEKVNLAFLNQVLYFFTLATAIYLSIPYGIKFVAISISVAQIPIFFVFQMIANRLMLLRMRQYLASLRSAILGSVAIIMIVQVVRYILQPYVPASKEMLFIILILTGTIAYFGYFHIVEKKPFCTLLDELRLKT